MNRVPELRIGAGQLPGLASRLLGYVPEDGDVALIACSPERIEHVAALKPAMAVDAPTLLGRMHPDVESVYLVGYGPGGSERLRAWRAEFQDGPMPVDVGDAVEVIGGYWGRLDDQTMTAEVERVTAAVRAMVPYEVSRDPEEVLNRLEGLSVEDRVSEDQAVAARRYANRLAQVQSPLERAEIARTILMAWDVGEDADEMVATATGTEMGATALFSELVREPAVRGAVIVLATEQPTVVRELVEAARRSHPSAVDVQAAAGMAVWTTGSDALGPVGSEAVARWMEPLRAQSGLANAIYGCAVAGEDPGPVVAALQETVDADMDAAEHAWTMSMAAPGPAARRPQHSQRTSIAGVSSGVTPHTHTFER